MMCSFLFTTGGGAIGAGVAAFLLRDLGFGLGFVGGGAGLVYG